MGECFLQSGGAFERLVVRKGEKEYVGRGRPWGGMANNLVWGMLDSTVIISKNLNILLNMSCVEHWYTGSDYVHTHRLEQQSSRTQVYHDVDGLTRRLNP